MCNKTMKDSVVDTLHEWGYKITTLIGGGIGVGYSFIADHVGEIFLTFLLGAAGAGGAGLIKFLIDKFLYKKDEL